MGKLRKGYVYYNPNAKFGEPIYHSFLKAEYTGFMPIASREDKDDFHVLRISGQFENEYLYYYKGNGTFLSKTELGKND